MVKLQNIESEEIVKEEVKSERESDSGEVKPKKRRTSAKKTTKKTRPDSEKVVYIATGRRKDAVARVRLMPGNGSFEVNGKSLEEYFDNKSYQIIIKKPLVITGTLDRFNIKVNVYGGGISGQAGAVRHGIARALVVADESFRPDLKKEKLLTRDPRMKERRKYGLKKARKRPQFSKR